MGIFRDFYFQFVSFGTMGVVIHRCVGLMQHIMSLFFLKMVFTDKFFKNKKSFLFIAYKFVNFW